MSAAKNLSIRLAAVGGDKVRQEFKTLGNDGQKAFRQITNVITPANDNLLRLSENTKIFNGILKQASYLAGAFLGFKGVSGTFSAIFEANKSFEQLSGSLKTVTGSIEAAEQAFALIEKFAINTPYQLNEIVVAFIQLKALGLEPSEAALTSYGNTASAFSKNILDLSGLLLRRQWVNLNALKPLVSKPEFLMMRLVLLLQEQPPKLRKMPQTLKNTYVPSAMLILPVPCLNK